MRTLIAGILILILGVVVEIYVPYYQQHTFTGKSIIVIGGFLIVSELSGKISNQNKK